ncbi:MAG: hypothetical protein ACYDCI_05645 [Candidatus Limnocylindrales bacterium]
MSDNGAAALAERLHRVKGAYGPCGVEGECECLEDVAAILANGAVFLPEGLDGLIAKVEALPVLSPAAFDYLPGDVYVSRAAVLAILRGER